jgi:beta-galactosidase/beta-glucuronidase
MLSCRNVQKDTWQPTACQLPTRWTSLVHPGNAWPDYPRPQMVRGDWNNLNGLWDYAITNINDDTPSIFQGKILVPYPVESALSGVKKNVGNDQRIWYRQEFTVQPGWKGRNILLHFEAVDWETTVWINGKKIGVHRGGYDPFVFDITDALTNEDKQVLLVSVWDPTDHGWQPRGKQVSKPEGIFYTSTTGIWQTVWIEPVGENYISDINFYPDIDNLTLNMTVISSNPHPGDSITINIFDNENLIRHLKAKPDESIKIKFDSCRLWTPESPLLYDLDISLYHKGELLDEISSYFGMREISLGKDEKGITRLMLNNRFVFQNGPLDQGFWPDGIYTPPTDEAMCYDLQVIKKLGFNMLRKHVKVESRRFYYWCDKIGILVWQDMPSGYKAIPDNDFDTIRPEETKKQFELELERLITNHFNHPSIIMWVPFNEGWGQYETEKIVGLIKRLDPTRLVDNASGWTDCKAGDVVDIHHYPEPVSPQPEKNRAAVLGEFGGLGLRVKGHTWQKEHWGYKKFGTADSLLSVYKEFYDLVASFRDDPGLSASIYTQITDVETECNGLMTYDREIIKMDERK